MLFHSTFYVCTCGCQGDIYVLCNALCFSAFALPTLFPGIYLQVDSNKKNNKAKIVVLVTTRVSLN